MTREVKGRKKFSKGNSSEAFSALGLNASLVKAIQRQGYNQPTPVQKKCIPLLLEGKDVVGLARTGSGKTAAFVLPLLQKLRGHSAKTGVRGLILSPNRELALQTLKFVQQMAKFTDLRVAALIGGDGLEEQFASMASNPDIVVATPGRLLHVCVETGLSLKTVSVVVWDEADRLLEDASMGEQLAEVAVRCPAGRQTALFSATLPKALADFARTGMQEAELVRLDAESQLSPQLSTAFMSVRSQERIPALLWLLEEKLALPRATSKSRATQQTVIFAATKHHVEYLQELLSILGYAVAYVYGSLDQEARESAMDAFRSGRKTILLVTDLAARGLDIPLLDAVVNFDFPAQAKTFVHRVGRVARAGREGIAYSLLTPDELAYLYDLALFLERPVLTAASCRFVGADGTGEKDIILGAIPQDAIDGMTESLRALHSLHGSLDCLESVMGNAVKRYHVTRQAASAESHRRAKALRDEGLLPVLPSLTPASTSGEGAAMLSALRSFKPRQSFLELSSTKTVLPKVAKSIVTARAKKQEIDPASFRDEANYLGYRPADSQQTSFGRIASDDGGVLSGGKDELIKVGTMLSAKLRRQRQAKNIKHIKTEYGTSVPASYKGGSYEKWCARTRLSIQKPGETESVDVTQRAKAIVEGRAEKRKWRSSKKPSSKKPAKK